MNKQIKVLLLCTAASLAGACAPQKNLGQSSTRDAEVNFGLPDDSVIDFDAVEIYGVKGTGAFPNDYQSFPSHAYKAAFSKAQLQKGVIPAQFNLGEDWTFAARLLKGQEVVAETGLAAGESECAPSVAKFQEKDSNEYAVPLQVCRTDGEKKAVVGPTPQSSVVTTTQVVSPASGNVTSQSTQNVTSGGSTLFVESQAFMNQPNGKSYAIVNQVTNKPSVDAQGNLRFSFLVKPKTAVQLQCQFAFGIETKPVSGTILKSRSYSYTATISGSNALEIPVAVPRAQLGVDADKYVFTGQVIEAAQNPSCK